MYVVVSTFNPTTQEAQAGKSINSRPAWATYQVPGSQLYIVRAISKNKQIIKTRKNQIGIYSCRLMKLIKPLFIAFAKI